MLRTNVSVVIPYYQAAQTVNRAVRSALMQTARPAEVLVVDDGSPEDAVRPLREFGSTVTLIRKSNGGAASARNLGLERARGEWIAFLDADDYWEPTKLERQLSVSERVGLVGSTWFVEIPGKPRNLTEASDANLWGKVLYARGSRAFDVAMNLWTGVVLVRKSVVGYQRFISGLEPAEDRDLWIRLVKSTSVYLLPEPLATYVQYEDSLSNHDPDVDCGNMLKVLRRHSQLLGPERVREQEAILYRRWASRHLALGRPQSAIAPAARRLAIQPTSAQAWWVMSKALGRSLLP